MKEYTVLVTNGHWFTEKKVPHGFCTGQEMAERMVQGLINPAWKVVKESDK